MKKGRRAETTKITTETAMRKRETIVVSGILAVGNKHRAR